MVRKDSERFFQTEKEIILKPFCVRDFCLFNYSFDDLLELINDSLISPSHAKGLF